MDISVFLQGAIVGFSIAAPIGPTGIICIRRTLIFGARSGFTSGVGAATANTIYSTILVSGLTLLSPSFLMCHFCLRLLGGAFLLYLGYKTFRSSPDQSAQQFTHKTFFSDFISTFFVSITNPITMISYFALFTSLGLEELKGNWSSGFSLVSGVFSGAASWWFILTQAITLFRKRITPTVMRWMNRIAGCVIAIFGLLAWTSLILNKLGICSF